MDDGANQATDLINKPKQKPERKKHRPKVITERKSRTRKIAENNDGSNETLRIEIKHATPYSTPGTSEVQAINHKMQEQSDSKEVATFKRKYVKRSTVPTYLLEENEASVDARTIGSGNMEVNQGSVRKNLSKHARSKMSTPRKELVFNQEMAGDDEDEVELQEISRLRSGKRSIKEANLQAAKKSVSDASYHAMNDRFKTKMVESRKHGNAEVLDDSRSSQASTVSRKQESNFESTGGSKLKFQHNHHYLRAELLQLADDSIRGAFNNQGNVGKSSMVYGVESQTDASSNQHGTNNAEVLDDSRCSQASTVSCKQESNFESTGGSKLKFQHNHHYSFAELLQVADDSIRGAFNNQGNAGKSSMVYRAESQTDTSSKEANLQATKKSVSDASYHAMIDGFNTKMVESRKHDNAEVLDDSRCSQASAVSRKQESNFESTGGSKLKFQHNHHYSFAELLQLADDSIRRAFNNQGNAGKSSMVYGGESHTDTSSNQHGKSAESNNRFVASVRQMKKLEKPALVGEEAKNYLDMNDELLHIAKGDENLGVHFQSNLKHARASTTKEERNHLQQSQSEDLGNGSKLKVQDNYSFAKLLRLANSAIWDTSNNQGNVITAAGKSSLVYEAESKSSLVYEAESQTDTSSNQHGKKLS